MNYKMQQQMYQKGDFYVAIYPRDKVFINEENFINAITAAMIKKASYRKRNYPSIERFKKECKLYMVRIRDVQDEQYEETKEEMEYVSEETKASRALFRAALQDKGEFDLHFPLDTQDKVMIAIFVATLTSPGRTLPCSTVVALVMAIRATKKLSGMEEVTEESVRGTIAMMNKCGVLKLQPQDDPTTTTTTTTTTDTVIEETKVVLSEEMENYDVLRRRVDAFLTKFIVNTSATAVAGPVVPADSPTNASANTSTTTAGDSTDDSTSCGHSTSAVGANKDDGQVVLPDTIPWGDVVWWGEEGEEEMRGPQRRTRLSAIGRCAYQINLFYRTKVTVLSSILVSYFLYTSFLTCIFIVCLSVCLLVCLSVFVFLSFVICLVDCLGSIRACKGLLPPYTPSGPVMSTPTNTSSSTTTTPIIIDTPTTATDTAPTAAATTVADDDENGAIKSTTSSPPQSPLLSPLPSPVGINIDTTVDATTGVSAGMNKSVDPPPTSCGSGRGINTLFSLSGATSRYRTPTIANDPHPMTLTHMTRP